MSRNLEIRKRIAVLEDKLKKSGNVLGTEAGLGNGTVDKWTDKHLDVSNIFVARFLKHYGISEQWWTFGDGDIFIVKGTRVRTGEPIDQSEELKKLKVFKDFFEAETDYRLIPKKVLDDYKIVPDKIIDIIIRSNDNERLVIEKNMSLEKEKLEKEKDKLIKEQDDLIEDYENRIKQLEEKNAALRKEKEELLKQLPVNKK